MTKKDLLEGLQYVEDELVEEAASPKKRGGLRIPYSLAAGVCLVICLGAVVTGRYIFRQNETIQTLKGTTAAEAGATAAEAAAEEAGEAVTEPAAVGIAGGGQIGSLYTAAGDYRKLYSWRKKQGNVVRAETAAGIEDDVANAEAQKKEADSLGNSGDYSRTNLMTAGVDESDIVKTDGKYLYMVQSGSVKITDIRKGAPGESVLVTPPFEAPSDVILEIYVDDGKMVVITSHIEEREIRSLTEGIRSLVDSDYVRDREETILYIYDISEPLHAKLTDTVKQDGCYHTSRKIGDQMYLFTDQELALPDGGEEAAVTKEVLPEWVPTVNGVPIAADCIYLPKEGTWGLVVSAFSLKAPGTVTDAKYIVNGFSKVYVSTQSIYLYQENYSHNREITEIAKLSFTEGKIVPGESTSVSGMICDAFALNEYDGYLRVLTSISSGAGVNTLYVLDGALRQVGRIDEIARGETVYAARFLGKLAYFVTYRNTDPLFAADLSDPAAPKLLGELSVTGVSEYLHPWDDTHLLGIGYETDPESGNLKGIKLSMFDISDPVNMRAENTLVLSGYNYSDAIEGNYKAVLADPGKNLIGFAMLTSQDSTHTVSYRVFSYGEDGFVRLLNQELAVEDMSGYRGVYVGDMFYIAGNGEIQAFDMKEDFEK